jgi:hypothetical protein
MIRKIIILALLSLISNASIIHNEQINKNLKTIQLGVYKNIEPVRRNVQKLQYKNEIYVEKINNYTIYIVNVKNNIIPLDVKKIFHDAFFINKKDFRKNELINDVKKTNENIIIIKNEKTKNANLETEIVSLKLAIDNLKTKVNIEKAKKQKIKIVKKDRIIFQDKIKYVNKKTDIFHKISLFKEWYEVQRIKSDGTNMPIDNSSYGIAYKVGLTKDQYQYYINFKSSEGAQALISMDYKYSNYAAGLSLGYAMYEIGLTSFYLEGLTYGFQVAYGYDSFEIGIQYLKSNIKASYSNVNYEINNINSLYFDYKF